MNTSEILELVRAGYTKADIEVMNGTEESKVEQEEKTEEAKAEQEEKTEEAKAEQEEKTDIKELTDLVKNLSETVKAMQADNARKASGEPPKKSNAESAIKSFFGDIPEK